MRQVALFSEAIAIVEREAMVRAACAARAGGLGKDDFKSWLHEAARS